MIANQAAVPYPLSQGWSSTPAEVTHDQHHCDANQRGALERHHNGGLAHGCRRGNGHDARLLSVIVVRYRGDLGAERPRGEI